jgi:hypothetical protein
MPGLAIQLTGAAFSAGNILTPGLPTAGTTTLWSYLGRDLSHSQNMMPGAPAITAIGTPVFPASNNYVTLSATNYLDTGLLDDAKTFTLLYAQRLGGTTGIGVPMACEDTVTNGFYVQCNNTNGVSFRVFGSNANITNFATANMTTGFKLFAWAFTDGGPGAGRVDFYNLTDNLTTGFTANTTTRTLATTGHVLLGQNPIQASSTQNVDLAFAAKISGAAWTLGQCQQALTNIRATLAGVGITV